MRPLHLLSRTIEEHVPRARLPGVRVRVGVRVGVGLGVRFRVRLKVKAGVRVRVRGACQALRSLRVRG